MQMAASMSGHWVVGKEGAPFFPRLVDEGCTTAQTKKNPVEWLGMPSANSCSTKVHAVALRGLILEEPGRMIDGESTDESSLLAAHSNRKAAEEATLMPSVWHFKWHRQPLKTRPPRWRAGEPARGPGCLRRKRR